MTGNSEKIALVTGASDGIGKETARQLARQGVRVVIGSRNIAKGEGVVGELAGQGLEVDLVQLDTCDSNSISAAAKTLTERFGRLDILVNNAGIAKDQGPLSGLAVDDLKATFETNVFGTFAVTQALLPLLKKSAHGRIVNVSSSLASLEMMTDKNSPYYNVMLPSYAASKAAINVMTIHLARELEDSGIKVNAVEPGLTATRAVDPALMAYAQTVEVGAESSVKLALIEDDGPTGGFFDRNGPLPW
ncbi:SDR family oxidoreductase [Marinobacterium mangrovicola]|uniref:Short-subunit dehydrogenase n=1 Tax=Marinobacterium mangrovicola TaxID=1476959 RepID=A0A4R1GPI0_9GAMM|nr:SDR family oxidoreductase [Marinobacterium mangrovicola]TCK08895.1 short-subunit dehydrogenase [Marinobacterium mangrovicola]